MEVRRCGGPGTVAPGLWRKWLPEVQEKPAHSHTDSFLTAARLLRGGGRVEEEGKTAMAARTQTHGSQGPQHGEVFLKDLRCRRVRLMENREPGLEKKANTGEDKDMAEGGLFMGRGQTERQRDVVVRIWTSGCRVKCRPSTRFRAPVLPAIAEV